MTIKHYTGQMTKKELQNTKIRILSEDHSKAFQEMAFEAGINWCNQTSKNVRYTKKKFLYIGYDFTFSDSEDMFISHSNQEITWMPIYLSKAPEDATHFSKNGNILRFIKKDVLPWSKYLSDVNCWDYNINQGLSEKNLYKNSDFIEQKEIKMTPCVIEQIREVLPKDAEISIGHDHINLFIDDYCFKIESIEEALEIIKEYQE